MSQHDNDDAIDPDAIYIDDDGNYVDAEGNPVDASEVMEVKSFRLRKSDPDREEQRRKDKIRRETGKRLQARGNARRARWLTTGMIAAPVIAVFAFMQSCSGPTTADMRAIVDEKLGAQTDFPSGQAVMWVGQVAQTWGTWDADKKEARAVLLSPYLSQGMDPQAGWNTKGKQSVLSSTVNPEPEVIDSSRAIITSAVMIDDGSWRCMDFKVYASKPNSFSSTARYAFALAGNPTPVACNPSTGAPLLAMGSGPKDNAAAEALQNQFLPGFFAAWASSDQATLGQYLDDGVKTVGLGGAYLSSPAPQITSVSVPVPPGQQTAADTVTAIVTVVWSLPSDDGATLEATYNVPLHRKGGQWFVAGEPAPSAQDTNVQGGAPLNEANPPAAGGNVPQDGSGIYSTPSTSAPDTTEDVAPGGTTP